MVKDSFKKGELSSARAIFMKAVELDLKRPDAYLDLFELHNLCDDTVNAVYYTENAFRRYGFISCIW